VDVPEPERVRSRTKVEGTPVKDPVNRANDWSAVTGHRREREQPHTDQVLRYLARIQPSLGPVDTEQVLTSGLVAGI
jgi:hypothetical protein